MGLRTGTRGGAVLDTGDESSCSINCGISLD